MLRVARRRASLEDSFEDFFEAEFTRNGEPDLTPSVYAVQSELERMHAEHAAGCGLKSRYFGHIDTRNAFPRPAIKELGTGPFQFTREAHHVFELNDGEELRAAARRIYEAAPPLRVDVPKRRVGDYVRGQLNALDREWLDFRDANPDWKVP